MGRTFCDYFDSTCITYSYVFCVPGTAFCVQSGTVSCSLNIVRSTSTALYVLQNGRSASSAAETDDGVIVPY
jgi:hypothetical protein